ncbi:hypothetical protein BGZ93_001467 [Podila epicladia]|nr:hypothetical protein BGZ92_006763 [Podila epicladia]KAG0097996.1 hypothetical protein BGZ93_001467 [Podila epicladia]
MAKESPLFYQTDSRKTVQLEDGLVLRWSTTADTDNVALLLGQAFRWLFVGDPLPDDRIPDDNQFVRAAARRLLSGKSSVMKEYDYALVEDKNRGEGKNPIVACVSLQRHEGYYGSVNLTFGHPELIATDPEYRNKGLIRHLINDMVHPESEARGDVIQFIPGILHFYRQFGYEYSMLLAAGAKIENTDTLPPLAKGSTEPYTLRTATQADIPFLVSLSTPHHLQMHAALGLHYTQEYWQYTVHDMIVDKKHRLDVDRNTQIIVDAATGESVGFALLSHFFFGPNVEALAVKDGVAYSDLVLPVFRQLAQVAKDRIAQYAREREEIKAKELKDKNAAAEAEKTEQQEPAVVAIITAEPASPPPPAPFALSIALHPHHPARILLGPKVIPAGNPGGFRIYTRIPSYPKFLQTVTPELERRLAASPLAGVSGLLRCDFFRKVEGSSGRGIEVVLNKGKIESVADWIKPAPEETLAEKLRWKKEGKTVQVFLAAFPPLVFSNLVCGRVSLEEMLHVYGDVAVPEAGTRLLLNTLFPKADHHLDVMYW